MTVVPEVGADQIRVVELSATQFDAAKKRALASLGLTYDELVDQARRRRFTSPRAHMLWVAIGGSSI